MTQQRALEVLVVAGAMGLGTWFGGWWAVPAIAAIWQVIRRRQPAALAGWAAFTAWLVLLATLPWQPLGRLALRLSVLVHLPAGSALLVPLGYAWLLAWSAARLVRGVVSYGGGGASGSRMAKVTTVPPGSGSDSSSMP